MIKTQGVVPGCKTVAGDSRVCFSAQAVRPSGPPSQVQERIRLPQSVLPIMDVPVSVAPLQAEGFPRWVGAVLVALAALALALAATKIRRGRHKNRVRLTQP